MNARNGFEPEVTDPGLKDAAALLRRLPAEHPPGLTDGVMAQVRPAATRRRRIMMGAFVAALVAAAAWAVLLFQAAGEGP